ncbi:MAG: aldo/keto reductase [Limosilactobacillus coleohominis]|uniref:aldo/keto reductase n=1 Tax=Limosilactobacillus coleohominis TaxID=181675 RepID=UPI002A83D3FD|nr:aldo/keto reductase [Limosilactobacillus coleohominis]MCI5813004.1 aldo/keto reductase [Lactobacillus sp.]MDY3703214.1 aldo/keto reductase [Limosilactobacillus coleohominis]MDY5628914.1 aldo/keto reductase [Limosilactobacillus coleohominis]
MTDIQSNYLTLADGQKMPQQGFGVYKLTDSATFTQTIKDAYEDGYRLFDTAQMYGNEADLGTALKSLNVDRDDYFITTKVAEKNQGYQSTIDSVKESLRKLQLDYVNLLLVHWPINGHFFETWQAFEDMKKEGLTKSIGVSNYGMVHLQYLATQAHEMPVVDQLECHPWLSEKPMIDFNNQHHIVTQAWAPLGRGRIFEEPIIKSLAEKYSKSPAQIILRWHLQNGLSFIPKSAHAARIKQNADIYDFQLTSDDMKQMNSINKNVRISQEPELVYEFNQQYPH